MKPIQKWFPVLALFSALLASACEAGRPLPNDLYVDGGDASDAQASASGEETTTAAALPSCQTVGAHLTGNWNYGLQESDGFSESGTLTMNLNCSDLRTFTGTITWPGAGTTSLGGTFAYNGGGSAERITWLTFSDPWGYSYQITQDCTHTTGLFNTWACSSLYEFLGGVHTGTGYINMVRQ